MAVRFARRPQTADDLIVAFLRKSQQPGQHAVVSNDRALAEAARRLGASVLTASRFADQMQAAPRLHPCPMTGIRPHPTRGPRVCRPLRRLLGRQQGPRTAGGLPGARSGLVAGTALR
ncbi:MAG: NYN domain-containing protein [Anaerolineae bacterium]|nr:MAG: NYN domain-containing protein [Anaerolineae bacterium]